MLWFLLNVAFWTKRGTCASSLSGQALFAVQPSFDTVAAASLEETCLPQLVQLFSELRQQGCSPPVIDATDLRHNPEVIEQHQAKSQRNWGVGHAPCTYGSQPCLSLNWKKAGAASASLC